MSLARPCSGRALCAVLLLFVSLPATARHPAAPLPPPLEPASTGGLETVDRALAKLSTHRRLMIVGAHPDDEDNAVLALVTRGLGGEAAYLSLSRGEGGQNLIGPELGVGLGLLRTGELLAARQIEGSRQFFGRAYDFGYTRSLEETFERWPREVLQEDAVRAVRRFLPQVLVAVFVPDARAGHGQHQASAVIAADAFELAGDPERFRDTGLPPWRPQALYRRAWSRDEATHLLSLAAVDPFSGRSVAQTAAASRSQHRSQDMGREQRLGPATGGLVWLGGAGEEGGDDPFAGIDTRLAAIAAGLPEGEPRRELERGLEEVERQARATRRVLSAVALDEAVPALAALVRQLGACRELAARQQGDAARAVHALVDEKLAVAESALAAAAGVAVDAVVERETVTVGEDLQVTLVAWSSGPRPVEAREVVLSSPDGWGAPGRLAGGEPIAPGELKRWEATVRVPSGQAPTLPYFLRRPLRGDLYEWSGIEPAVQGEPLQPPPLVARFDLVVEGAAVGLEREVVFRVGDQAYGEVRRPLRAVPRVEVAPAAELLLWNLDRGGGDLGATVKSNASEPVAGRLRITAPAGWTGGGEHAFRVAEPFGTATLRTSLAPPEGERGGRYRVRLEAEPEGGASADLSLVSIDYPDVRPLTLPVPAEVEVSVFEVEVPELAHLGYVEGASDRVPGVLRDLGMPVRSLDGRLLAEGDLSEYDAIVVGSRAYETVPALGRHNGRLLEYVRAGGLLIVQYQQYQFIEGGFAPYPLEIARPHGRVTDETAPVRVLASEHPALHRPNELTAADWAGWVQERGLYFADSWDAAYTPLLALADPGQDEQRGGLLIATLGRGTYVYTGLSFFRQLPAGVPGAIRLFANLLSLGGA